MDSLKHVLSDSHQVSVTLTAVAFKGVDVPEALRKLKEESGDDADVKDVDRYDPLFHKYKNDFQFDGKVETFLEVLFHFSFRL